MTCPRCHASLPEPRLLVLPCRGELPDSSPQMREEKRKLCTRAVTTKQAVEPCGKPGRLVTQRRRIGERVYELDVMRCEEHGEMQCVASIQ